MNRLFHILLILAAATTVLSAGSSGKLISDSRWILDEFGDVQCEDYLARMDNAIIHAQNNPTSKVLVIVYEGKLTRYRYDRQGKSTRYFVQPPVGTAKARIRSIEKYLKLRGEPQNFVFIDGGAREEFRVQLFLVPPGAKMPEPLPALKNFKYGKGKPKGFCLGCCGP